MKRDTLFPLTALIVLMVVMTPNPVANAGGCLSKKCGTHRAIGCPKCDCKCYTCELEADIVDVKKTCFEVEEHVICIPKVVFPWQRGKILCQRGKRGCGSSCDSCGGAGCNACVRNGAKIRKIKKLKTKKYTCPECEYRWTAKERFPSPCRCEGACDGGCDTKMASPGSIETLPAMQPWQVPLPSDEPF